jgi:hypothetical protein
VSNRRLLFVMLALVVAAAGCESSPNAPTEAVAVTLAPGESASVGALKLTFVRITGDSRCPGDAVCITAGDAQAAIDLELFGVRKSAEIYLFNPAKRQVTAGPYSVTFELLTPYPFLSLGPIAPAAYRATFEIRGT